MKNLLIIFMVAGCSATLLYLRFTGRVQPWEMSPFGKALFWLSTFLLSFAPITILLFKLLRHYWGYDASPLAIAVYAGAVLLAGFISSRIAHWVADPN